MTLTQYISSNISLTSAGIDTTASHGPKRLPSNTHFKPPAIHHDRWFAEWWNLSLIKDDLPARMSARIGQDSDLPNWGLNPNL